MLNPSIYSASKIWHAIKWQEMRSRGFNVIATWIDIPCGTPENPSGAKLLTKAEKTVLWDHCTLEAAMADMVVVYAEQSDEMRGVLVEMGVIMGAACMAHAIDPARFPKYKPIYIIGDCVTFQQCQHSDAAYMQHASVIRVPCENYRIGYEWARTHWQTHALSKRPDMMERMAWAL